MQDVSEEGQKGFGFKIDWAKTFFTKLIEPKYTQSLLTPSPPPRHVSGITKKRFKIFHGELYDWCCLSPRSGFLLSMIFWTSDDGVITFFNFFGQNFFPLVLSHSGENSTRSSRQHFCFSALQGFYAVILHGLLYSELSV